MSIPFEERAQLYTTEVVPLRSPKDPCGMAGRSAPVERISYKGTSFPCAVCDSYPITAAGALHRE
jgi:hypothetical protein